MLSRSTGQRVYMMRRAELVRRLQASAQIVNLFSLAGQLPAHHHVLVLCVYVCAVVCMRKWMVPINCTARVYGRLPVAQSDAEECGFPPEKSDTDEQGTSARLQRAPSGSPGPWTSPRPKRRSYRDQHVPTDVHPMTEDWISKNSVTIWRHPTPHGRALWVHLESARETVRFHSRSFVWMRNSLRRARKPTNTPVEKKFCAAFMQARLFRGSKAVKVSDLQKAQDSGINFSRQQISRAAPVITQPSSFTMNK
ncbi:unnamed protein product [Protopolystoma xenopodis]|uniref:Uncharacterized protein n=1 Tax=Protopolystoma xenopodis TaxID=117903 RepID=A0A448WV86_9PLAT|nr:unnamed protein product [Protopolystoma xenopodis]